MPDLPPPGDVRARNGTREMNRQLTEARRDLRRVLNRLEKVEARLQTLEGPA